MKKVYVVMWDNNSEYNECESEYDSDFWGIYSTLENARNSLKGHCEDASEHSNFWILEVDLDGTKTKVVEKSRSVEEWLKELN